MIISSAMFLITPSISGLSILIFGLGLLFLVISLTHRIDKIEKWDVRIFHFLYSRFYQISGFFTFIWPIGTTPVAILLVAMTYLSSIRVGIFSTAVYSTLSMLEYIIKINVKRERPFSTLQGIRVYQPVQPKDPSFPSGDAMRSWFLALTIPMVFNISGIATAFACLLVIMLSLGRIALGVHYPLDVVGGMGLGLIGTAIVSYSINSSFIYLL